MDAKHRLTLRCEPAEASGVGGSLRTAKACGPGTPGLVLSLRMMMRRRR
jgi:hypothetical protein